MKAFLVPHKRKAPEPVVRFETEPGRQMQADFTIRCSRRSHQTESLESVEQGVGRWLNVNAIVERMAAAATFPEQLLEGA